MIWNLRLTATVTGLRTESQGPRPVEAGQHAHHRTRGVEIFREAVGVSDDVLAEHRCVLPCFLAATGQCAVLTRVAALVRATSGMAEDSV